MKTNERQMDRGRRRGQIARRTRRASSPAAPEHRKPPASSAAAAAAAFVLSARPPSAADVFRPVASPRATADAALPRHLRRSVEVVSQPSRAFLERVTGLGAGEPLRGSELGSLAGFPYAEHAALLFLRISRSPLFFDRVSPDGGFFPRRRGDVDVVPQPFGALPEIVPGLGAGERLRRDESRRRGFRRLGFPLLELLRGRRGGFTLARRIRRALTTRRIREGFFLLRGPSVVRSFSSRTPSTTFIRFITHHCSPSRR